MATSQARSLRPQGWPAYDCDQATGNQDHPLRNPPNHRDGNCQRACLCQWTDRPRYPLAHQFMQNEGLYVPLSASDTEVQDVIYKETWRQLTRLNLDASEVRHSISRPTGLPDRSY
jgi:hypothetical protein